MSSRTGASVEYNTAQRFKEGPFTNRSSYLWPGRLVWTDNNIASFVSAIASKDTPPAAAFIDRLHEQLSSCPPDVHIIAADCMVLYYLFPTAGAVRTETKLSRINTLLSWSPSLGLPDPKILLNAFDQGIGGVGLSYLNSQPFIMAYFAELARRALANSVLPDDMPAFLRLADTLQKERKHTIEARNAILHAFFPDDFEPTISQRQKRSIVETLGSSEETQGDIDSALRAIRARLETQNGRQISFYEPEIFASWHTDRLVTEKPDDPIPGYQEILLPLLKLTADGKEHKEAELVGPLARYFELSNDDLERKLPSGAERVFSNRIRWAKVSLRQARLIEIPQLGYLKITEQGRQLLDENPASLSRNSLKRYPEYVDWLGRNTPDSAEGRGANVWIEKTIVKGRPDREAGEHALGRALWSPMRDKSGKDIYRFMRDVQPGDVILHLTDNFGFTAISTASGAVREFPGLEGTDWGVQPSYLVPLASFRLLEPPLPRETFFGPPYSEALRELKRSGKRNLFYSEDLTLNQGAYLTPAPPELVEVLNEAYTDLCGHELIESPVIDAPVSTEIANSLDDLMRTTLWSEDALNEILDRLNGERPCRQVLLSGPPGTGKTWVAQQLVKYLTKGRHDRWRLVQFHPSFSYEQFIEGLRPSVQNGAIEFKETPGILLNFADKARESNHPYYLVIDEMNRANLPRVFGELMYLFEYRNEIIDLPYTRSFSLPNNLFFVATMNTADRSIRTLDTALRRRFEIFECLPDVDILRRYYETSTNQVDSLFEGFVRLNQKLEDALDRHHTIGHTFFMAPVFSPSILRNVWRRRIAPLIEEYFFDQPDMLSEYTLEAYWRDV